MSEELVRGIDKPEYISAELKFIKDGEKYGWD